MLTTFGRYILKLYDENFSSHFPICIIILLFISIIFYIELFAVGRPNLRQVFEKHNFLGKAIEKSHGLSKHTSVEAKEFLHFD
jgi:hypothetical protein